MTNTLESALSYDIERYEQVLGNYLAGDMDPDQFRIFRLGYGIYGQRQGGDMQMVRVKLPAGNVTPLQLRAMGKVAQEYSRGWGHVTTRQNFQFHFVKLQDTPKVLQIFAKAGLTSREACGDTVRNIAGCPFAGYCPSEVIDITPWVEAAFRTFLRHPYAQRLPRKFKINFSGCERDCGQGAFNDVGVIAVSRQVDDKTTQSRVELGFRVFIGGGLGANPKSAVVLEEFTPPDQLLATIEAVLRTFDHYGNRDNKVRARMKWLVETMGKDELLDRILRERKYLVASARYPDIANYDSLIASIQTFEPQRTRVSISRPALQTTIEQPNDGFTHWFSKNVYSSTKSVTDDASERFMANVTLPLGDITSALFEALADIGEELGCEIKTTNRQNLVFLGLGRNDLERLYDALVAMDLNETGCDLAKDVVSCPGADTCNLAVTQSRGLSQAISTALEKAGLEEVDGVRINISGCTNSCGQHHIADIGLSGAERRAHSKSAPGYQLYLGGHLDKTGAIFAKKTMRLPAKNAPEAVVFMVDRFSKERIENESFSDWIDRSGGSQLYASELSHLDEFPDPILSPDFYRDFGEDSAYVAEVGEGECAGS